MKSLNASDDFLLKVLNNKLLGDPVYLSATHMYHLLTETIVTNIWKHLKINGEK